MNWQVKSDFNKSLYFRAILHNFHNDLEVIVTWKFRGTLTSSRGLDVRPFILRV